MLTYLYLAYFFCFYAAILNFENLACLWEVRNRKLRKSLGALRKWPRDETVKVTGSFPLNVDFIQK